MQEFASYVGRPLQPHEYKQKEKFKGIFNIINSRKDIDKEYEGNCTAFLNPHDDNWMKVLLEEQKPSHTLFLLSDLSHRKTNEVLECFIPNDLVTKYGLKGTHNLYIAFSKFKKVTFAHPNPEYRASYPTILLEDFEIRNPIELRAISSQESRYAEKLRNDLLFDNLDGDLPSYVKLSIIGSLFLSPKMYFRSGIEAKSLLDSSTTPRAAINLDYYNSLLKRLIPSEISNHLVDEYRVYPISHTVPSLGEKFDIHISYPTIGYYYNSSFTPHSKEDPKFYERGITKEELGINHQTKFNLYHSKKAIVDKMSATEFFYKQDYLASYRITNFKSLFKLIEENKELLYNDYIFKLMKPIKKTPFSVGELRKIDALTETYLDELGYKVRQGRDALQNCIRAIVQGNLVRVKSVITRGGFIPGSNMGEEYLNAVQLNFGEIREARDYKVLPLINLHAEDTAKILNDPIRRLVVTTLKICGGISKIEGILNAFNGLGHDIADIMKELENLKTAQYIEELNGYYILDTEKI